MQAHIRTGTQACRHSVILQRHTMQPHPQAPIHPYSQTRTQTSARTERDTRTHARPMLAGNPACMRSYRTERACLESEKGEVLLRGVGTLRCFTPPNASLQWQPDGLTIYTNKWVLGARFLGARPISLVEARSHRDSRVLRSSPEHYPRDPDPEIRQTATGDNVCSHLLFIFYMK